MTAMWFGLAAIALVGAIALLYFDRVQRQRTGHARQVWAKSQGYTYVSVEPALPATWRRGALAKLGYLSAVDVVSGIRKGEKFVLFDLEDSATLVAVRRQIGSDIDVDMRLKTASPPKDADLELLGAIGDRVVFATNPEIARHAVDQRMVAFIESLPDTVQMLWSEGNWTVGMLAVGTSSKDWETTIDAVLRLSGLLHVLPPVAEPRGFESSGHDPGRPYPKRRPEDEVGEPVRSRAPEAGTSPRMDRGRAVRSERDHEGESETESERGSEDRAPSGRPYDGPVEAPPTRRPSLAVVPDARTRTRDGRRPQAADEDTQEQAAADRPDADRRSDEDGPAEPAVTRGGDDLPPAGGPFHPGFRPYQGPVPQ
ncbi:hypothetical protein [Nocardia arizonensis]|uniref:hypothetical protein n=1 Tax=Nocardia arizonensis TaxID=1141647 RepID=UPI0009EB7FAB|nr:hypothetical protein [Nocardia arizonensis]